LRVLSGRPPCHARFRREAFELLYTSFLYSKLEQEQTKLWHLSPVTLANLLNEELETGSICFPEEA
jgi:hypothetical protein